MFQDSELLKKFHALPKDKQSQVIDFIEFLDAKSPPHTSQNARNLRGVFEGQIWMSEDFDAPLEDFADYM